MKTNLYILTIVLTLTTSVFSQCFTTISSGQYHAAGKKTDGTFWIWGGGLLET